MDVDKDMFTDVNGFKYAIGDYKGCQQKSAKVPAENVNKNVCKCVCEVSAEEPTLPLS